ncbi:MAG: hypothetical protein GQ534_08390 [Candidatus Delongbacteria bacterium]|nr:hypothetical protein [Candidatus Delongbacteria bacterium]
MFQKIVNKYGTAKSAYLLTLVIILIALSVTSCTLLIFQGDIQWYEIILPVIIPIIIFPLPAKSFFDTLEKLEQAEKEIQEKNIELEKAIKEVKILEGIFPICSSCKQIRDDDGKWNEVEICIEKKSDATFSHSLCPECVKKLYPDLKSNTGKA